MGVTRDVGGGKCFPAAKPCDYCNLATAVLFCRGHSAFMCMVCDAKLHNGGGGGGVGAMRHEKVWMCEVCEQAPAAVTCKADAAALCVDCDRDIHSANPLARRHDRPAVIPFYDIAESVVLKSTDAVFEAPDRKLDGCIPDPWISTNSIVPTKLQPEAADAPVMKSMDFLFSDSEQFLDFDSYRSFSQPYGDSLVPVQTTVKPPLSAQLTHQHSPESHFEIDFTRSNITSYTNSYTAASLCHSVSSSSMDVGVVPDGNTALSKLTYPPAKSSIADPIANHGSPAAGTDREARVLRYREKKKNRKFEKTVRYASRKAYAEARPRVKGRFAKRNDSSEAEIDGILSFISGNLVAGTGYDVVPSF